MALFSGELAFSSMMEARLYGRYAAVEEQGKDVTRQKNWEWAIKENEEWEKKLARKVRKADFEFHGMFSPLSSLVSLTLPSMASSRRFTCCTMEIQEGCR